VKCHADPVVCWTQGPKKSPERSPNFSPQPFWQATAFEASGLPMG
jgi:hypothetical protein